MKKVSGRFLKKAPQKLFCSLGSRAFSTPREAEQKSFFGYFFFKKSNIFPPLS